MKLISWNVNSIRIRLSLLAQLVATENPDVVCLQEVKAKKEDFPFEEIQALGFIDIALYSMAGYNGVAILSKTKLSNITEHNWVGKTDARHISAEINGIEINNIYIPAGGDIADPITNISFAHKLTFMDDISEFFEQNEAKLSQKKMLLCGDFNVAPLESDVWNHKQLSKVVSHTPIEIERLTRLYKSLDFVDCIRKFHPEPQKFYTWWSYRNPNWQSNNKGRRLDHIWASPNLAEQVKSAQALKEFRSFERPSDHIPVMIEIN